MRFRTEPQRRDRGARSLAVLAAVAGLGMLPAAALPAETKPAIDALVAKHAGLGSERRPRVAGLVVGVVAGGEQSLFGYGTTGLDHPQVPDGRTVFEIGSITKVFTAAVLALMDGKGELTLDDPVAALFTAGAAEGARPPVIPEFEGAAITLLHLATHTSGLPRLPGNLFEGDVDPDNPYAAYTPALLHEFLSEHRLGAKPGSAFEYSNLGFGLLGQALEARTGKSYEALVAAAICEPLGMAETRIVLTPSMASRLAKPYRTPGEDARSWDIPALAGAGALRSTGNDMLRFVAANIGLPETDREVRAALEAAHAERHRIDDNLGVGLGWHIVRVEGLDEPVVWHNGETGGYHSFAGFVKAKKAGVVVLANTAFNIDGLAFEILTSSATALPAAPAPAEEGE